MSIEANFNIAFVAELASREKQIQQNYRPIIAVHKWFARRPGTLFRALTLAEFGQAPVEDLFFEANSFPSRRVADPFMGGGTPLIEANRVGCDVLGCDINPMSAWIVREEIDYLDLTAYRRAADALLKTLAADLDALYRTDCPIYGDQDVPAKTFMWVKEIDCEACGRALTLYPGYLLAEDARHPANVVFCGRCGQLNEAADLDQPGTCRDCGAALTVEGPAKRNRCACQNCQYINTYPRPKAGPPRHRLFAIGTTIRPGRPTTKGDFSRSRTPRTSSATKRPSVGGRRSRHPSCPTSRSCPATKPPGCTGGAMSGIPTSSTRVSFSVWNRARV